MPPYLHDLADTLNRLTSDSQSEATVSERASTLYVSGLSADYVRDISKHLNLLDWPYTIADTAGNSYSVSTLPENFGPFSISISKPSPPPGVSQFVHIEAFLNWARGEPDTNIVEIASIDSCIKTHSLLIAPWDSRIEFFPSALTTSPRTFVREVTTMRKVVSDLSSWITPGQISVSLNNRVAMRWAREACITLSRAFANEIDPDGTLIFRGPPSTKLQMKLDYADFSEHEFSAMQEAARWVFTHEKDAETKHALLSAEIARLSRSGQSATDSIIQVIGFALDSAKIAFQLNLSGLSRESLKAMADLRKAVADETNKIAESTQKLAAAVIAGLFVGVGAVAARLAIPFASDIAAFTIVIVGFVTCFYIISISISGHHYIKIQQDLRSAWRDRLYRFLPDPEYDDLVKTPINRVEVGFRITVIVSIMVSILLSIALVFSALQPISGTGLTDHAPSKSATQNPSDVGAESVSPRNAP